MSDEAPNRYIFSGHAIGAAARFNKLDQVMGLNHVIPALGASVLPAAGGVSRSEVSNYSYEATVPRRRSLLSVARIESRAEGREIDEKIITDTEVRVESITFLEKLYIDCIHVRVQATRPGIDGAPSITGSTSLIEGVHLGSETAKIVLHERALEHCGRTPNFTRFIRRCGADPATKKQRNGAFLFTIVKEIQLSGTDGGNIRQFPGRPNVLYWEGFGWIYFGEVIVKGDDRQVTMLRLQMGSDGGGTGTAGDAHSNGSAGSN